MIGREAYSFPYFCTEQEESRRSPIDLFQLSDFPKLREPHKRELEKRKPCDLFEDS
jgi:hypothetical protein